VKVKVWSHRKFEYGVISQLGQMCRLYKYDRLAEVPGVPRGNYMMGKSILREKLFFGKKK
jgi:hypothetical protein